jgi:predicted RNase H-like HicB family nuclease
MQGHFTLVLLQCESWWVGWVSELPAVNSQAETRDGLLDNLRWALDDALDVNRSLHAVEPQAATTLEVQP